MTLSSCVAHGCGHAHHAPAFVLAVHVCCDRYNDWLARQARGCRDRDRGWAKRPELAAYKNAIHRAVLRDGGADHYTGMPIRWDLLLHQRSSAAGRAAHRKRGKYPSVDHYNGPGAVDYRICTGQTNGAKGALTHQQFVELLQGGGPSRGVAGFRTRQARPGDTFDGRL